jgi:hypothetical protein
MSERIVEKKSGSGEVVNPTSGTLESPPAAQTEGVSLGHSQITWLRDPRPTTRSVDSRSLTPHWEITEYTAEEFNAFVEADKLSPELAEHYKDYLED